MQNQSIISEILSELKRAKKKHPNFPEHIVSRAAIISEESGELIRAAIQFKYETSSANDKDHLISQMKKEAIQTAAMCIRFIQSLNTKNH